MVAEPEGAHRAEATMSSWRNAGLSFLKYSQLCAEHVRSALKEPMKSKKIANEGVHARIMKFEGGKRVSTGARTRRAASGAPIAAARARGVRRRRGPRAHDTLPPASPRAAPPRAEIVEDAATAAANAGKD